jgi:hypothetical protein
MDALYKLFAEDQVVLLKMNPVNEYPGPFFSQSLRPLIARGFVRIVNGGAARAATSASTRRSTRSTSPAPTRRTTRSCSGR